MTRPVTMADVEHVVNTATRINITSNNRIRRTVSHLIWFMAVQMAISVIFVALLVGNQQQTYKQIHANVDTYTKMTESACSDIKSEMHESLQRIQSHLNVNSSNP